MKTDLAMTNESFSFLESSSVFVNLVLNNINSCVLLLDKSMILRAFNDSMKTIFSNHADEDLLYKRCGEAIGCAYQIEEQKNCGETSRCNTCELKQATLTSYTNNEVVYKEHIIKPFFDLNNQKIDKHLQFSTRLFKFNYEKYVIMIIEDISKHFENNSENSFSK